MEDHFQRLGQEGDGEDGCQSGPEPCVRPVSQRLEVCIGKQRCIGLRRNVLPPPGAVEHQIPEHADDGDEQDDVRCPEGDEEVFGVGLARTVGGVHPALSFACSSRDW